MTSASRPLAMARIRADPGPTPESSQSADIRGTSGASGDRGGVTREGTERDPRQQVG